MQPATAVFTLIREFSRHSRLGNQKLLFTVSSDQVEAMSDQTETATLVFGNTEITGQPLPTKSGIEFPLAAFEQGIKAAGTLSDPPVSPSSSLEPEAGTGVLKGNFDLILFYQ